MVISVTCQEEQRTCRSGWFLAQGPAPEPCQVAGRLITRTASLDICDWSPMKSLPVILTGAFLAVLSWTPQSASAHAELASSDPRDGASLKTMPDEVVLELSEQVKEPAFVAVANKQGRRVNSQTVAVDGRKVSSAIVRPSKAGSYTVSYRIVSADAHVVSGTLSFVVTHDSAPATTSEAASSAPAPTSMAGENVGAESRDDISNTAAIVFILIALVVMTGLSILLLLRLAGRAGKE